MGSFARKLKHRKSVATTKANAKRVTPDVKDGIAAERIVNNNKYRMELYIKTYFGLVFCYIMKRRFKMCHSQITHMLNELDRFEDFLTTNKPWRQPLSTFSNGLEEECNFKVQKGEPWERPLQDGLTGWICYYGDKLGKEIYYKHEVLWLWIMHDSFGFSTKRLTQCSSDMRQLSHLSFESFSKMCEIIHKEVRPRKKDESKTLDVDGVKELMKVLIADIPDEQPMEFKVIRNYGNVIPPKPIKLVKKKEGSAA